LLIVLLTSITAGAASITPLEGLELARKGFSGVNDFTAEITQEKQIALMKKTMKSSGKVRFKRPDLFYMEVYSPYPSRLLLKDNVMNMALPADGIKQQNVLPKGEGLLHWFMLLDRPLAKIPDGVEVRAERGGGILTLSITPKEKRGVRDIRVTLMEDGRPRKIVIEEQNLDRTVINFRRVMKNVGLTENDFRME
jgi:outer membrane lipoprotein carrier protein